MGNYISIARRQVIASTARRWLARQQTQLVVEAIDPGIRLRDTILGNVIPYLGNVGVGDSAIRAFKEANQADPISPWGATITYGALAAQLHKPLAVRAVGAAVGRNPWSIVVPCHRVLGADGSLTGYAGGLARKQDLLTREGVWPKPLL